MLGELVSAEVEFVIVGSVAAVVLGISLVPPDLDIVYRRTRANVARLNEVLRTLNAGFMGDLDDLMGRGDFHLITSHGKLDVLGEIGGGLGYEDLLPHSVEVRKAGLRLNVLDLPMQIQLKETLGRVSDINTLELLKATLARKMAAHDKPAI